MRFKRSHVAIVTLALVGLAAADEMLPSLAPEGVEGETIVVRGSVLDRDGHPVAGAEVFAYHADTEGRYHDDAYRGTIETDARGTYAFETIHPGGYGPEPHIHFKVEAAGRGRTATLRLTSPPRPPSKVELRGEEVKEFTFDIRLDG